MSEQEALSPSAFFPSSTSHSSLAPALRRSTGPLQPIVTSEFKLRRAALIKYKELKKKYLDTEVTYTRQLYLRHITARSKLDILPLVLMQTLNRIANDLLMEELEVALWAAFLDKANTVDLQLGGDMLLLFSAYSAKLHFTTDAPMFEAFCVHQSSDFTGKYQQWRLVTDMVSNVSLQELNKVIASLSQPRTSPFQTKFSDYNALVTQLINEQQAEERIKEEPMLLPAPLKSPLQPLKSDEMHLIDILSPLPSAI